MFFNNKRIRVIIMVKNIHEGETTLLGMIRVIEFCKNF